MHYTVSGGADSMKQGAGQYSSSEGSEGSEIGRRGGTRNDRNEDRVIKVQ